MQVLSDGVPMTCGEVYALLRRRRDERSAMRQPPFALQLAQADPRSRLANRGNNNSSNALTATAAAAAANSTSTRAIGANGNNMASHVTTTTPMNVTSHVFVLLSEVQLLSYLYHHGRLSTELNQSLPALYGPSSVYVPVNEEDTSKEGVCDSAQLAWLAKVRECQQKVAATQPGREDHVQHVQALLTLYEERGQTAEADAATAVRRLLRDMHTQGYWPCSPPQQPTQSSADVVRVKQEVRDDDDEQLAYEMNNTTSATARRVLSNTVQQGGGSGGMNGTSTRRQTLAGTPLLSAPSSLLCDDFAMQAAPTASRTVADLTSGVTTSQGMISGSSLLSEEELMRVVMARPCSSLDVHRLLDGLDERLAGREEAVTFFVEGLTRIFTRS